MLKNTLVLFLFVLPHVGQANDVSCQSNSTELSAQYQIISKTSLGKKKSYSLNLFRRGNNVAYQYQDSAITEYWHQQTNGFTTLTRYFERDKKAIEYQANEINNRSSWQQINEIISPKLRDKMQLVSSHKQGCQLEQKLRIKQGEKEIQLTWLAKLNLIKKLTIITPTQTKTWQLQQLNTSTKEVSEQFSAWQQYQSTDYADIGDNESDPFFTKMINLGFIEHAASGFYQADGKAIASEHHH